jgi:uncharacterized protein YjbK
VLPVQVEIKLRLPSKDAHDRVAHELRGSYRETHQQENYFFDGPKKELSAQRSVLRCRFYNGDKRALVTLKARHTAAAVYFWLLFCSFSSLHVACAGAKSSSCLLPHARQAA